MMAAFISCSNPNFALDRTAGSHSLAAAGQRGRYYKALLIQTDRRGGGS